MAHNVTTDCTGVILVGGKSRRMGVDKAFLKIGGIPLFERVLTVFRENFATVILIGNNAERYSGYGLPVYSDIYPGSALGGLYTGLMRATTPHVFVASCDLPFPSNTVLRHLLSFRKGCDVVVPADASGFEPLFAVYAKSCLAPMQRLLEQGNFCIFDIYPALNVKYIPIEELLRLDGGDRAFINVNTPDEFRHVIDQVSNASVRNFTDSD
jgi:molybdopterin-guanine dinucleotide biosynthesis protein A